MFRAVMKIIVLSLVSVVLIHAPAHAKEPLSFSKERLDRIAPAMDRFITEDHVTGCVTLLLNGDNTIHFEAHGQTDRENGSPIKKDSIFRIASMTKPITITAAMILYEEGKFLLDDPVSRYIPEFANPKRLQPMKDESGNVSYKVVPAENEITIRHLMNHTSGLSYGDGPLKDYYEEAGISNGLKATDGTIGDMVKKLAKLPLMHNPGEQWTYGLSNDVLGYCIEIWSGVTLEEFMLERIFEPLGMPDTSFYPDKSKLGRVAAIYYARNGELVRQPDSERDAVLEGPRTYFSGGGGLFSTALDYSRFARMLLSGGELDGTRIISRKSVELMRTDSSGMEILGSGGHTKATHGDRYGLGLGIRTHTPDIESIGTYGWGGAFNTLVWIDPVEDIIGIFMSQVRGQPDKTQHRIFRILAYSAIDG